MTSIDKSVEQQPPKLVFPCDYPIRIIGSKHHAFSKRVLTIMQRHTEDHGLEKRLSIKESREGRYLSLKITIKAEGEAQIAAIFKDLKTLSFVKMVL